MNARLRRDWPPTPFDDFKNGDNSQPRSDDESPRDVMRRVSKDIVRKIEKIFSDPAPGGN